MVPQRPELGRSELREQYRLAVEEYRFQVELNWKRSEYFFVLNVAILLAAVTLLSTSTSLPREVIALVFLVGAGLATASILANRTQHGYYRAARDVKGRLETQLGLDDLALSTTPGMGSRFGRLGQVRTFLSIMLAALVAVNLTGFVVCLAKAADGGSAAVRAIVHVVLPAGTSPVDVSPLVVSRGERVIRSAELDRRASVFMSLEPGWYRASIFTTKVCAGSIRVTSVPLQSTRLDCSS